MFSLTFFVCLDQGVIDLDIALPFIAPRSSDRTFKRSNIVCEILFQINKLT